MLPLTTESLSNVGKTLSLAYNFTVNQPGFVAGRLGTMALIGSGITLLSEGVPGIGFAMTLNAAAVNGNVRDAAEGGMDDLRDFTEAALGK